MAGAQPLAAIGKIKLYDPATRRGVIEPRNIAALAAIPDNLYFDLSDSPDLRLRVGQLVRFTLVGNQPDAEVRDIAVLSELA